MQRDYLPQYEEGENIPRDGGEFRSGSGVPSDPDYIKRDHVAPFTMDTGRYGQFGGGRHTMYGTGRKPNAPEEGPPPPHKFGLPPGSGETPPRFDTQTGDPLGEPVSEPIPHLEHYRKLREDLERPIKMNIETPNIPSQLAPQFRRASARIETNREFRDARWSSYSDIGAA